MFLMPKITSRNNNCEICLVGKNPRNSFKPHVTYRSVCMLDVVHSDVNGTLEVP